MAEMDPNDLGGNADRDETEMFVNEYGETKDGVVVVEEADRTVMLTPDDTIIIEKEPQLAITPSNRPRKVYAGMWGQTEIATVGVALLAVLTVILLFVFLVIPSNKELEENRAELDRTERDLMVERAKYGNITTTEGQVAKLISSVDEFETNYLRVSDTGRNALYQKLNGLISAYGLVNTTGPDYVPLETADVNTANQSDEERGRAKYRSLFPGVYVTTTVEGSYVNLRRFIREIESGSDFIMISAVELEPSDSEGRQPAQNETYSRPPAAGGFQAGDPNGFGTMNGPNGPMAQAQQPQQQQQQQAGPRGKTHGETVSLRLEMAAYFQRPGFVPQPPPAVGQ